MKKQNKCRSRSERKPDYLKTAGAVVGIAIGLEALKLIKK